MDLCVIAQNRANTHKCETFGRIELFLPWKVEAMWIIFFNFAFKKVKRNKDGKGKRQGTRHRR